MGYIPLRATGRRGYVRDDECAIIAWAKVDPDDWLDLAAFHWHRSDSGYAMRCSGGRKNRARERMHRRILGLAPGDRRQVDHINRDKLDNRRSNLRVVSGDAQNRQNVPARGGFSPHRGVTYDSRRGHWVAQAKCKGAGRLYARCATEAEAAAIARAWRAERMPFSTD